MNILLVATIPLYKDYSAGGETINFYLNYLVNNGHRVRTISKTPPVANEKVDKCYLLSDEKSILIQVEKIKKGIGWLVNPNNKYSYKTSSRLRNDAFAKMQEMRDEGFTPHIVILEMFGAYLWVDDVKNIFPETKIVADVHDIGYQGTYNRLCIENKLWKKYFRKRFCYHAKINEIKALSHADLILVQNPYNRNVLLNNEEIEDKKILYISPYYTRGYSHKWDGNYDILFYGSMKRQENYTSALWFIKEVLPKLPKKFRFIVMGGNPVPELITKANEQIIVTGFVDDKEVKKRFESAFCFVCPLLYGSGIKTRLLTALDAGIPVLTNDIGIDGIEVKPGVDYFNCKNADDYVASILRLADNELLYHNMEYAGRNVVAKNYNMERSLKDYGEALLKLVR